MADQTTHHSLDKPADGETDWGTFLNSDLDDIDTILKHFSSDGEKLTGLSELTTEALGTTAEHIVNSKSKLQSAFSNLSAGDTIWIEKPATPYRTDQWLDIDVDGVTVVAASRFADDGEPIIKVADGADVGGIRAGNGGAVNDITIRNVGYHGNSSNQDQSVKRLHGIYFVDVTEGHIEDCYLTRTSPDHEHNSGGSGITAEKDCSDITITENRIHDIGDRGIQVAGDDLVITDNRFSSGYDRNVSLDVLQADGNRYAAYKATVIGNLGFGITNGSHIGGGGDDVRSGRGVWVIANNACDGTQNPMSRLVQIDGSGSNEQSIIAIVGNVGVNNTTGGSAGIRCQAGTDILVASNVLVDFASAGIKIAGLTKTTVRNNHVINPAGAGIQHNGNDATVSNNYVRGAGTHGIRLEGITAVSCSGNYVSRSQQHGILCNAKEQTLSGNIIDKSNQGSGGDDEIHIAGNDCKVVGNVVKRRDGAISFAEASGVDGTLFVGNVAPDDSNAYSVVGSGSIVRGGHPVPTASMVVNGTIVGSRQYFSGIADAGKEGLAGGDAIQATITVINTSDDTMEMFTLHGGGNTVTQHGIDTTNFGTTEDNDGTVNVYWASGNSQYELNNEEGASKDFEVHYTAAPA